MKKGVKVLDIGCGDCTSIREINASGAQGYGIEPDLNIRPIVDLLGLNVHVGLYHEMDYPEKFFDYITLSQVLEHIHRPHELLIALKDSLKDTGQLILGVPNIDSRLRKKYAGRWLNWHVPYHINHFSVESIKRLVAGSGYKIRSIRTYTPNMWVLLQQKMLRYPLKEGYRVPFFNGESEPAEYQAADRLMARVQSRILRFLPLDVLFLRAIDFMGAGESLLIIIEKK